MQLPCNIFVCMYILLSYVRDLVCDASWIPSACEQDKKIQTQKRIQRRTGLQKNTTKIQIQIQIQTRDLSHSLIHSVRNPVISAFLDALSLLRDEFLIDLVVSSPFEVVSHQSPPTHADVRVLFLCIGEHTNRRYTHTQVLPNTTTYTTHMSRRRSTAAHVRANINWGNEWGTK